MFSKVKKLSQNNTATMQSKRTHSEVTESTPMTSNASKKQKTGSGPKKLYICMDFWCSPHDIGKTRIVLLSTIFDYFFQMSLVEDHTESTSSGLGINNHMLAKLIALPLTDREELVMVQYLVQRYRTDVRELIYMTLLIHYYLLLKKA